jgi:hypothetical protein
MELFFALLATTTAGLAVIGRFNVTKHVWWLLLLAGVAFTGAEEPAKPGRVAPDMEKLMQLYRDFGLPLPPAEAPLVRVPTGWRDVQADGKTGSLVTLGFLLNSAKAEVLCGTWKFHVRQEEQADMKTVTADGLDLTGLSFKFESDAWPSLGPAVAMQCYARGDKELAAKLVAATMDQAGGVELRTARPEAPRTMHGDPGTFLGYAGGGPEVHLAAVAWSFWVQELMNPETDRKRALAALQQVLTVAPGLADTPRQQYLKGLAATLKPSLAAPGSMEAAIDALVECRGTFNGLRQNRCRMPHMKRSCSWVLL